MNKVFLIGRITKDVELRHSQKGVANVSFTIAVDRQFKDANGEKLTDFINCVAWNKQADFLAKYVIKGNMLAIDGRLQTRSYVNNQNQTVYVTEVICDSLQNLTPRAKEEPKEDPMEEYQQNYNFMDEDLPF